MGDVHPSRKRRPPWHLCQAVSRGLRDWECRERVADTSGSTFTPTRQQWRCTSARQQSCCGRSRVRRSGGRAFQRVRGSGALVERVWTAVPGVESTACTPDAAADAHGNFVVVWWTNCNVSVPRTRVQARRYASSSASWGPIVDGSPEWVGPTGRGGCERRRHRRVERRRPHWAARIALRGASIALPVPHRRMDGAADACHLLFHLAFRRWASTQAANVNSSGT